MITHIIHTYIYRVFIQVSIHTYISFLLIQRARKKWHLLAMNTPSTQILDLNTILFGELVESKIEEGNLQDELGVSCSSRT